MKNNTVLVTGGNGHLGNTLAKALCDKGYNVHVTVRNPEEVKSNGIFEGYSIELYQADIRDESAIRKAMEGVSGVFQVAALYNFNERTLNEGIVANNTEGSQTVLKVAKECGIKRVVMTSSIVSVGFGGTKEQPMTEEHWNDPDDPYCRSKVESEKEAWEFAKEQGLDLVILCPGLILGPNFYKHTASTINVSTYINNQVPFRFSFQPSIVDVRDVAEAHIMAYENKEASGRYLVSGIHVHDLFEMLNEFEPEMVLPERMLTPEQMKALSQKSGNSTEMIGQSFIYSDQKIQSELGWKPRPVEQTLQDTINWIKERGL